MLEGVIVLACYACVLLVITYCATRATKTRSDFLLGGRQNSGFMTAMAAGTSDMGSWLMMALPAFAFSDGLQALWLPVALMVGAYLNWTLVAPRLRVQTERMQTLTIPSFLSKAIKEQGLAFRRCLAFSVLIFFTIYVSASFVAGALLLGDVFALPYEFCLVVCSTVIVVYAFSGGFKAVSWIDFMQGLLMFVVLVAIFFLVYTKAPTATEGRSWGLTTPGKGLSWAYVLSCVAWGLGYFGQFHIALRFMAVRSVGELPLAKWVCLAWMGVAMLSAVMVGLLGRYYYLASDLAKPEMLLLIISEAVAGPWVKALVCSAILSAIMSSASAQLLLASSALVDDLLGKGAKDASPARINPLTRSRLGVALVAAIALAIAANPQTSVLGLVGIAWAGIGASFGPLMLFSLFWSRINSVGAGAGVMVGTLCVVLIEVVIKLGIWPDAVSGGSLLPGFLCSSATIYWFGRRDNEATTANDSSLSQTP